MSIQLKITNMFTGEKNGYGMPIIDVICPVNLEIYNRGYNEFECKQNIDENSISEILEHYSDNKVMLRIKMPVRNTVCWYSVEKKWFGKRIIW